MKKKLLVLLVVASSMLMPNLASAIAIHVEDWFHCDSIDFGGIRCDCAGRCD